MAESCPKGSEDTQYLSPLNRCAIILSQQWGILPDIDLPFGVSLLSSSRHHNIGAAAGFIQVAFIGQALSK